MHEAAGMFQRPFSRFCKPFGFSRFTRLKLLLLRAITPDASRTTSTLICGPLRHAKLQKHLAEELARKLTDEPLHLQIKKRSENVGGVQAGVFRDVVNRSRLVGTEGGVDFLAAVGEGRGDEQIALLSFGLFSFGEGGACQLLRGLGR